MHSTVLKVGLLQPKRERRKKTGLQACVCTFQPGNLTGWGSEGFMGMVSVQVELNDGVVSVQAGLSSGVCLLSPCKIVSKEYQPN